MLSPEYLEQLPTAMVQLFGQLEEDIIIDMARRIAKTGTLTDTAEYQAYRLQELGAQRRYVMQRLSRITGKAKEELNAIFADAARTTLTYDNELFEQAGYSPAPLDENAQLQQLVWAYRKQTSELFFNLTQTTARTASKQFERALDRAAMQVTSGAFSYQQAIRTAVKSLAAKGVDTIVYRKNGHITQVTSTEVAVRRAVLTGVNQMASHVQLANAEQLGCDLVQVTAHGGARPEHAEWQGGVYSISGRHPKYKKLSTATGYGTGDGLCGWNCRHNFFPFFEGLSDPANTAKQLWDMEHAAVTYNGEQIPLYEATQRQRSIERAIRRWKREYLAMEAAGQDTTEAAVKLKKWRTIQADFCEKTGLRVDGFRGQVQGFGRSAASKAGWTARKQKETQDTVSQNLLFIKNDKTQKESSGLPPRFTLPDTQIPHTVNVDLGKLQGVVPKGANATDVYVMAGKGTSTHIRDLRRLYLSYPQYGPASGWQKKSATAYGKNHHYVVHWYENEGGVPLDEIKLKGAK